MSESTSSGTPIDPQRLAQGLAKYHEVYGDDAVVFPPGSAEFFDVMIAHLFGEVWTRPALALEKRRLMVMGVLAAQYKFETLGIQFTRALARGEMNVDEVRETVLQLIPYVGYPSSGDLYRVAETAIADHLSAPTDSPID